MLSAWQGCYSNDEAAPQALSNLFFDKTSSSSKNFMENIRYYNNMFSFTSMGGKINEINSRGGGPYSYVLSGQNHHSIGSLLPPDRGQPVFSQLYICDTENEIANHIGAVRLDTLLPSHVGLLIILLYMKFHVLIIFAPSFSASIKAVPV